MASHTKGVVRNLFCAQRKKPCRDDNNYRTVCAKPWQYQAHHVLCVASVTQFIGKKTKIQPIVKQTKWCINNGDNLLAMPMWGTINTYYNAAIRLGALEKAGPPFQNIPVHSYDHAKYQKALNIDLANLADQIADIAEKHEDPSGTLAGALEGMRAEYKDDKLLTHGTRARGTHREWLEGLAGRPSGNWYLPFSMADDPEPRTFPARRSGAMEKVAKLMKKLF